MSEMDKYLSKNRMGNINAIDMILIPFDSSQLELSNKLLIIKIGSLDAEITLKYFYYLILIIVDNYSTSNSTISTFRRLKSN